MRIPRSLRKSIRLITCGSIAASSIVVFAGRNAAIMIIFSVAVTAKLALIFTSF